MSGTYLDIYIGFGQRRGKGEALHWIFMYAPEGETQSCTWLHVTGSPNGGYKLQIQAQKRLDSFGISTKQLIGRIPAAEEGRIKGLAKTIPMQQCQRWATALVAKLEQKALLPPGIAAKLEQQIEPAPTGGSAASGTSSGSVSGSAGGSSSSSRSSSSSSSSRSSGSSSPSRSK